MDKLLVILGPTATGKTDIGIHLAKKINGEIISADSRQLYKSLDIGTGKLPVEKNISIQKGDGFWIIDGVKIWMYDVVSPNIQYSIADYIKKVKEVIESIKRDKKTPIIVGGTGFYINALLKGIQSLSVSYDKTLRANLIKLNLIQLQNKLQKIAPDRLEAMNNSDKKNPRRLVRAIEVALGKNDLDGYDGLEKEFSVLKIGLIAEREVLYEKSDKRLIQRLEQGMVGEVEKLVKKGISINRLKELGLEYRVLAEYIEQTDKNEDKLFKALQEKIHGYIKRQLTWFKKEKDINWFDVSNKLIVGKIEKHVIDWYNQS